MHMHMSRQCACTLWMRARVRAENGCDRVSLKVSHRSIKPYKAYGIPYTFIRLFMRCVCLCGARTFYTANGVAKRREAIFVCSCFAKHTRHSAFHNRHLSTGRCTVFKFMKTSHDKTYFRVCSVPVSLEPHPHHTHPTHLCRHRVRYF